MTKNEDLTQNVEVSESMQQAVETAMSMQEPVKEERKPYLFETVGRFKLGKNKFPVGTKKQPELLSKIVDGQIVELHKPRTVINRYTKKPEVVGIPIKVKDEKAALKYWTDAGLVTSAENYKFWEDREAFNKVIRKGKK